MRGRVVRSLKIDLGADEKPPSVCCCMLRAICGVRRSYPRLERSRRAAISHARSLRSPVSLQNALARGGLARRYVPVEENLPYLRRRLLFREHNRENLTNRARFYVTHDELSVNRPANRLIHSALAKLKPLVRNMENRRLLRSLRQLMEVAEVPQAANPHADWQRHQVDRSMPHYRPVMQWVGLFLFGHGLATFSGPHRNLSLLFPMEEVFEDFVTHSFRRYQKLYDVSAQGPEKPLAKIDGKGAFLMKPDISLKLKAMGGVRSSSTPNGSDIDARLPMPQSTASTKTICINSTPTVSAMDVTRWHWSTREPDRFKTELRYRFFDGLTLVCLPFNVENPKESVESSMRILRT